MFQAIYKKFLTAIDHIDYHPLPDMQSNALRTKRSISYDMFMDAIIPLLKYYPPLKKDS